MPNLAVIVIIWIIIIVVFGLLVCVVQLARSRQIKELQDHLLAHRSCIRTMRREIDDLKEGLHKGK